MHFTIPETPYVIEVRAAQQYGSVPGLPIWEGALYLDLLLPKTADLPKTDGPKKADGLRPAVVYLHGGGWRGGERSAGMFPWISPQLAAHGFVAANVTYRLSGVASFPAQLHDVKAAVRWLRANADTLGIDRGRIGVWGDSAGGQLAALLGTTGDRKDLSQDLDGEGNCGSPGESSAVQAVIARCAPSDFVTMPEEQSEVLDALFGGPRTDTLELRELASPARHVHKGVPPFLIVHGTNDETVPYSQAETMVRTLREHNADVTLRTIEGGHHNLLHNVDLPWGNDPWTELGSEALEFFRRTLQHERE